MHIKVCFEQTNCYKYFINKYCRGGSQSTNQGRSNFSTVGCRYTDWLYCKWEKIDFLAQTAPPSLLTEALTQISPFLPPPLPLLLSPRAKFQPICLMNFYINYEVLTYVFIFGSSAEELRCFSIDSHISKIAK